MPKDVFLPEYYAQPPQERGPGEPFPVREQLDGLHCASTPGDNALVDAEFAPDALSRLARCLAFWQARGFQAVSLPWIAQPQYTEATRPVGGKDQPKLGPGRLVASGEQSFLQLADRGQLVPAPGYVGWSPCVRQEQVFDATHHLYFMKVELFVPVQDAQDQRTVDELLAGSLAWNAQELHMLGLAEVECTVQDIAPNQWDIELAGLELGSYGLRRHFGITYAYGTGCAEPRFTQAVRRAAASLRD